MLHLLSCLLESLHGSRFVEIVVAGAAYRSHVHRSIGQLINECRHLQAQRISLRMRERMLKFHIV